MPLPCIPPPPVSRDTAACIAWLGLAHATCVDTLRRIREQRLMITPEAERILLCLREWLHYALTTEHNRRSQRRRGVACSGRTWFCYLKYEKARKSLLYHAAQQTVSIQIGTIREVPVTTL
ncbi:E4 ORF4 [Simian adenovirus ch1]|nr:E4 ORF4 [Simian adenovirus ch1]